MINKINPNNLIASSTPDSVTLWGEGRKFAMNGYKEAYYNASSAREEILALVGYADFCHSIGQWAIPEYKDALDCCMVNEKGDYPQFMEMAFHCAYSIQNIWCKTDCGDFDQEINLVKKYYYNRFGLIGYF